MKTREIEVSILVDSYPVRKYSHEGRTFIEAKYAKEYSIRVKNSSPLRKLVVATVDGINVLDGLTGGISRAGYVLDGFNSFEIKGFRTSNEEVHPFVFKTKADSYAAKSDETGGDTSNCGVIGVAVYDEKIKPLGHPIFYKELRVAPSYKKLYSGGEYSCGTVCCSSMEEARGFDAGTEFSSKTVSDKVYDIEFEVGKLFTEERIYYAFFESLKQMGVNVNKTSYVSFPEPFPTRFCKFPVR